MSINNDWVLLILILNERISDINCLSKLFIEAQQSNQIGECGPDQPSYWGEGRVKIKQKVPHPSKTRIAENSHSITPQ